jgi:hypothetical protein
MPVESKYPPIQIPDVGIWDLLFHREQLPFPEDKSKIIVFQLLNQMLTLHLRNFHRRRLKSIIQLHTSQSHRNRVR